MEFAVSEFCLFWSLFERNETFLIHKKARRMFDTLFHDQLQAYSLKGGVFIFVHFQNTLNSSFKIKFQGYTKF